jgi:hypothetical protein
MELCSKIPYNSFREAQEVLNSVKDHKYTDGKRRNRHMGNKSKRPIRSYKCDICNKWHLTSKNDRK